MIPFDWQAEAELARAEAERVTDRYNALRMVLNTADRRTAADLVTITKLDRALDLAERTIRKNADRAGATKRERETQAGELAVLSVRIESIAVSLRAVNLINAEPTLAGRLARIHELILRLSQSYAASIEHYRTRIDELLAELSAARSAPPLPPVAAAVELPLQVLVFEQPRPPPTGPTPALTPLFQPPPVDGVGSET